MSDLGDLIPHRGLPRGLTPTPRSRAFAAIPHLASPVPDSFAVIPPRLSYWHNDTDGICVSAEEMFAKAAYSVQFGLPELYIPDDVLLAWARRHGWLNGANCVEVIQAMVTEGITVGGTTYRDGPPESVDWTDDAVLSSAIFQGPVKIAVAADQLEHAATPGSNGWFARGFHHDGNIDHCVSLCGFGTAADLARLLGTPLPADVDAAARSYLMFTWNSIGIIDRPSLLAITGEAWLRTPTTPGMAPVPTPTPTPTPDPIPVPVPTPQPTPTPVPTPVRSRLPLPLAGNGRGWNLYLWRPGDPHPTGAGIHPAEVVLADGTTVLLSAIGR